MNANKPNILVIMSDQLRHDALGCNGNETIRTPNLDRLAASGIRFTHSFTPNPVCVPARISFTTGCYSHKAADGMKDNGGKIQPGFPKIGEELNERGYETYAVGKLHYLPYRPPGEERTLHGLKTVELAESGRLLRKYDPLGEKEGVEDYHDYLKSVGWGGYTRGHGLGNNDIFPAPSPIPEQHYVDTWVAERAMHYMDEHQRRYPDKPFFMWASMPKPHSAYDPPRPYDTMYDPRNMPEPVGDIDLLRERGLDMMVRDHYNYIWDLLSPEAKKVIKAHYYGMVSLQDKLVGRLLDFLEQKQLRDNTIVIFTSDHGDLLGDFGLYFKRSFYNGSVKVPLLISFPGVIKPGQTSHHLVGLQDLLPTLLSLIGEPLRSDAAIDGLDLTPVCMNDMAVRDYYISQCNQGKFKQRYMVTNRKWKYIYHSYGGVEELYDEEADPRELVNLAGEQEPNVQRIRTELRNVLTEWVIEHNDAAMIQGDGLLREERIEPFPMPDRPYLFGRRFY